MSPVSSSVAIAAAPAPTAGAASTASAGPLPGGWAAALAWWFGGLVVVAGSVLTALGSVATHGVRRAGSGRLARHR